MSCAIKISNSSRIKISNCNISGFDIGIDADNSNELHISNTDFFDVKTGIKLDAVNGFKAINNQSSVSKEGCYNLSPVALAIKNYIKLN